MELPIKKIDLVKDGAVRHYTGDDGYPAAISNDLIVAETADGRHFFLPSLRAQTAEEKDRSEESWMVPVRIYQGDETDELLTKIRARGTLRPAYWVEYEPDTRSLEERWADEAMIEAQDRFEHTGRCW
jgi:hypothetical protein